MNAIGLIEVIGYIAAIEAGDACVKAANVNIVSLDKVGAGIVTITVSGDVGAVKAAVEAAQIQASKVGTLRSAHVIPRINSDVANALFKKEEKVEEYNSEVLLEEKIEEDSSEEIHTEEKLEEVRESENIEEEPKNSNEKLMEVLDDKEISDDLSKCSVKELKALAKKFDSTLTYKQLNTLKKEELIDLVKKLGGDEK